MTARAPRPPRLARWLLRLRPLGSRRAEIEADLHEAFLIRAAPGSAAAKRRGIRAASFFLPHAQLPPDRFPQ
jgi:hypothetical protein